MDDPEPVTPARVGFGPFEFDGATLELRCGGVPRSLPPQPARLLGLLIARAGQLVTREEIRDHLWGGQRVEFETSIHTCVRRIRAALEDDPAHPVYIQTLPRRGYRFVAATLESDSAHQVERAAAPEERATEHSPALEPRGAVASVPGPVPVPAPGPGARRWRGVAALGLVLALVSALLGAIRGRDGTAPSPVVVVLPFENLTGDADALHQVQGLCDEMRIDLARHAPERIRVIARTSSLAFRERRHSAGEIGTELGATHLVEGSVRALPGGEWRVSVHLVRTADQIQVWAERFERRANAGRDFALPMAARIVARLIAELDPEGEPPVVPEPPVEAAQAPFLRGRYLLWSSDPAQWSEAVIWLEAAVRAQPDFAAAHALYARALLRVGEPERAEVQARRALELDPEAPEPHLVLARLAFRARLDVQEQGRWVQSAFHLAPHHPEVLQDYAAWLCLVDRDGEALRRMQEALRLDPISTLVGADMAWFSYFAGDLEGADRQARAALQIDPDFLPALDCRLAIAHLTDEHETAAQVVAEILRVTQAPPALLRELESLDPVDHLPRYLDFALDEDPEGERTDVQRSCLSVMRGDLEQAARWAERGLEQIDSGVLFLPHDPRFEGLWSRPDFAALLARLRPGG